MDDQRLPPTHRTHASLAAREALEAERMKVRVLTEALRGVSA